MPSIDAHALVAVALIFALGVMSPGPNFMVIAQRSVSRGRADGLATMLGVVTVSGIWAAGSLFGIGLLFALFPWARLTFRMVGAAYLIWLGVKMCEAPALHSMRHFVRRAAGAFGTHIGQGSRPIFPTPRR